MRLPEDQLIQRLLDRETRAMTLFYCQYQAALYAAVRRIIRDRETAEDVLQEGMVRVWHSIAAYDASRGRLFTWAVKICCNAAIDHVRTSRFRLQSQTDSLEATPATEYTAPVCFWPEHIGIADLLLKLRPQHRQVLELLYWQGYTQLEIATELQVPLATVKTWSNRAKRQLAKISL